MRLKLFCKHEYKYFNTREVFVSGTICFFVNKYDFVCKKCGKNITIDGDALSRLLEKEKGNMRKKQILNKDYVYSSKKILIPKYIGTYIYEGKFVDCVLQKYKKYGIDLLELSTNENNEEIIERDSYTKNLFNPKETEW